MIELASGLIVPEQAAIPAGVANRGVLFGLREAGMTWPMWRGETGAPVDLTDGGGIRRRTLIVPGTGTGVTAIGCAATVQTATARTFSGSSYFGAMRRVGSVSASTAGATAVIRHSLSQFCIGSAGPPVFGGFLFVARFALFTLAASPLAFVGLSAAVPSATGTPATTNNHVGFWREAAETTWSVQCRQTGSVTKTSLGSTYPADTTQTDVFKFRIYCPPAGTTIYWDAERENTGNTTSGTLTTNLPQATTMLMPVIQISNNTTAAAVSVDAISLACDSDT